MTDKEQTDAFANALDKLVETYRAEWDLSYAQAVGTLTMKAWLLMQEASEHGDET